jgi:hypothetical protein
MTLDTSSVSLFNNVISNYRGDTPGSRLTGSLLEFEAHKAGNATLFLYESNLWTGFYELFIREELTDKSVIDVSTSNLVQSRRAGEIELQGDKDVFEFTNHDFFDTKTILVSVSSAIDSQLMPSLSLTNDFSDQSNPPKSMILTIPPSAASSVYVTASDAFGLGSTGAYQLTYQEITDDIPANLVKPIVLNQSSTSEMASFDFENDADSFSFVSIKKASYRISISSLNDEKLEFESSVDRVDKTTSTSLARLTEFNNSAIVALDEYETVSIKVISHESIGSYIVDIAIIPDFDPITDSIPGNMSTRAISKISGSQSSFLGTIETAGDSDWIKLDVEKSGQYTIQLLKNGESGLADPHLAIRDSDGKILIADDDSGGDRNSKLLIVLDAEKTYYADVTGFNLTIGSYILHASMISDSGNASVDIGDVLSSNFRSIINPESGNLESSIDAPYDRDAYLFTPDRSGKLSVSLKSTSGLDTVLEVVSANTKQTLAINDNHGLTSDSRIEYSVTSGEKIYLVAYGFGKSIGSYKISWQIANVTNTQANDPPSSIATFANSIPSDYDINTRTNPFILNGDIDTNSDIDLFRWTPDEDATASVSLSSIGSSHLDPALRIIDSTGKTIIRNDDGGEGLDSLIRNFHFQSGKSYFIECSSSGNQSTGKYQLQLAIQTRSKRVEFLPLVDEAPNTPELSTPMIQFDGSFGCVVGNIRNTSTGPLPDLSSYNSDIDTYQVKMPAAGGAIDIRVGRAELPGSPSGSLQPSLIVLDGSMQVTHRFSWNGNGTVEPVWTISATANSTFYLQISGQNQSGGGYRISLVRKNDDVSNGVAYGTVPILAIGRPPESYAIEYAGDQDAFQIQTLNSQRLRFEVIVIDSDKNEKIKSDAVVRITDSNGVELARTGSHNNGSSLSIEIDTIPRQSLYAIISGYGTDNPIYSIRVASMTRIPGDEAGDSIVLARQLTRMPNQIGQIYTTSANDEYEPAIQSPDDIDFWSFTAQTTGQYNIHIDKSNISYAAVLRSYREEDSAHAGNYVPDADGNIDFQFNARAGEEIYIKVAGWSIADSLLGSKFINGNHYSLAVKFVQNTDHAFTTPDILRQVGAVLDDSFGSKYLELLRVSSTLKNARSTIDSINSDLISILQDISTDTVTPIFCLWLDPIDFIVSNAKGQMVGSIEQVGNINQIASAGISNRGNLDLVVIANPDINALNISLYGIGGGRVLGGASYVIPGNNLAVLASRIDFQNIGKEGSENNKIQLELIFDKRIDPEKPRIPENMIPTNLSIIVKLDMTKFDPTLLTTFFAASLNAVASIIPAHDEIGSGVSVSDGFSEPTQLLASISGSKSDENEFWPLLGLRAVQFVITPVTATMTKLAESIFIIPGAPIVTHLAEKIVSPAANALTSAAHAVIYVISESQLIREWGKWHKITIQPSLNQTIKSVASMLPPVRQIDLFPSSNHNPIVIPSNPVIAPATAQSPKTPSFNPGAMIIAVGWGFAIRWDRKKRQGRVRQVARIYFS